MPMPFFSVIITAYNRAETICRAIDSLIAQSEKDWECIIVDDGSSDDTNSKIKKYLSSRKFRYFHHANRGAGFSKNRGISEAEGIYITFLDSDDEFLPEHLSERKKILMEKKDIDLIHGGCRIIGNPFVPDVDVPGGKIHLNDCIVGGTFFVKRSKALEIGGFRDMRFGDDVDFFRRANHAGFKIMKTYLNTYVYHRDGGDSLCDTA